MSVAAHAIERRPEVDRLYAAMTSPRVRDGALREHDESMRAQVCVVGSGAGGAPLASTLACLGHSVILLEEGAYRGGRELGADPAATRELLLRPPVFSAAGSGAMPIPVARCVGGTTMIGAGTSHRVPHGVLATWERDQGLGMLDERELARHYDRIEAELRVAPVSDAGFGRNAALLERGARELGFAGGRVRRAAPGCLATGVCELGCPQDAKLGMHASHVPAALEAGALLYVRTRADKLLLSGGRVFGVQASFLDARGVPTRHGLRVVADRVVVACGALATPALLARSGVAAAQLGRNLHLQPAARVVGSFADEVRGWAGVPQAYEVGQFHEEGIALEGHFAPPVELAHSLRAVGRAHKAILSRYASLGAVLARIGDAGSGSVRARRDGSPSVDYRLGDADRSRMLRAISLAAELLFAAGATEVHAPLRRRPVLRSVADAIELREADVPAADLDLIAHHPLGTARMAADPNRGVTDPFGAVHGVADLFVADASVLPSAITVAPQTTIAALALRTAQHLSDSLGAPL